MVVILESKALIFLLLVREAPELKARKEIIPLSEPGTPERVLGVVNCISHHPTDQSQSTDVFVMFNFKNDHLTQLQRY